MLLSSGVCLISARVVLGDKPVPSSSLYIPMLLEETKKRLQFFTRIFYCCLTSLVEFPFFISMSVIVKAEQGLIM